MLIISSRRTISWLTVLALVAGMSGLAGAQNPPGAPPKAVRPAAPADPAAVLKVIPADATAVLAIRNIAEVDFDIVELAERIGLPLAQLGLPNPLSLVKEQIGLTAGLEENSGVAIAILSLAAPEGQMVMLPERLAVFVPCSDPDALATSLQGQKQPDRTYMVMLGAGPGVAAPKGKFLVIAPSPDALREASKPAGDGILGSMSADRVASFAKNDLFGWFNMRAIPAETRSMLTSMLVAGAMQASPEPQAMAAMAAAVAQVNRILDQIQEVGVGVSVDPQVGLTENLYVRLKPDTELARALSELKPLQGSPLAGLPDEPTVFACGGVSPGSSPFLQQLIRDNVEQAMAGGLPADNPDSPKIKELIETMLNITMAFDQTAMSISSLPPGSGSGLIGVTMVSRVADAGKVQADIRQLLSSGKSNLLQAAMNHQEVTEEESKALDAAIQIKPNAEKLAGAVVDQLVIDLASMPDITEEDVAQLESILGTEGIVVRIAAVGEKNLAISFGGGIKRLAQVVETVQKGQAPLAEKPLVRKAAEQLPSQKVLAQAFLNVDRVFGLLMNVSSASGQPMPFLMPMKETVPIAYSLSRVEETGVEVNVLVPVDLAQNLMQMAQPFIGMMLMGGMGGGQPMMPPPEPGPGGPPSQP